MKSNYVFNLSKKLKYDQIHANQLRNSFKNVMQLRHNISSRFVSSWFGLCDHTKIISSNRSNYFEQDEIHKTCFIHMCIPSTTDSTTIIQCHFEEGQTLMEVCIKNSIPIEAACGGQCACTTCHEKDMELFPEPKLYEDDMLDLALNSQDTSRLGCQLQLTKKHHGIQFTLPTATWNQLSKS